ncbi:hypothetical protein H8S33_13900 [Ornithinibacillus sp. BX22]|uniref:YviE n=2 Tax=Ornithinibacillus TaxID=484508 RepID=A0A923L7M6_9BACI|nr:MULTISPECIES: DUF6470 family protein [Ornithinibacillus]MBC5637899.1 hypothetical protein [Ornithinibacillus hominis]MBS3681737.1 hypothetical protein [Ornithinibacillus massiliensis]
MELPQIRMQSQMARISMMTQPAKQEIRQPKADLFIQQPHAELSMRTIPSKLTIDQTQAWADMNLKSAPQSIEEFAQLGMQGAQEGTARRATQGTELMKIENNNNPIVSQAVQNAYRPQRPLGIQFIPSVFSVKINYQPSEVEIDIKPNKPIIETQVNKPELNYTPGSVDVSLDQYAELDIDFINLFPTDKQ